MALRRAAILLIALTACGEVTLAPAGNGVDQDGDSPHGPMRSQPGTTNVVTSVVPPAAEDLPAGSTPDCAGGGCPVDADPCGEGACACPTDRTFCAGTCVNLDDNRANCGACGNVCPTVQMCKSGVCTCKDGQSLCGLLCVPTMSDVANCGGCGTICLLTQKCDHGSCVAR